MIRRFREGCLLEVRVQPRASRDEIVGWHGEALKVRLKAPPVEGRANEALVSFLASVFSRPRREVEVVSGLTSRRKSIYISGVTPEEAARIIEDACRR